MSAPPISVRLAVESDVSTLGDLATVTFRETYAATSPPHDLAAYIEANFHRSAFGTALADPRNTFFLTESDGLAAGYANLRTGDAPDPLDNESAIGIQRLYILKAFQGRGAGAALMQYVLDRAAALGHKSAWLGVWQENPRAVRFYERWGFEIFGTETFQLGTTAQTDWLMKRPLE